MSCGAVRLSRRFVRARNAEDSKVQVSDVELAPKGVGTTWHIMAKGVVTEDTTTEYVEFAPDQRIVWKSHPKVTVAGKMTKENTHGPTWTWTFAPENGGTKLTVVFLEKRLADRQRSVLQQDGTERTRVVGMSRACRSG